MSDVLNVIIPTFVITVSLICCCLIVSCSCWCCTLLCNKESNQIVPLNIEEAQNKNDYIVIIHPDNKLSLATPI